MSGTTSGDTFQGVSNCYVFKSRLQEFAQKVGFPTPTYETIKDGPSHEPTFKSTVIVKDVRYDSLSGFHNRKAAEQSAAEIALLALSQSGNAAHIISQPTHETGLCKNLLQEYAQKMNHAIPLYECKRDESSGRIPMFSCTVEIGGMKYIGGAAKTKKEAEIKAARTAMLSIQATSSSSSSGSHLDGQSNLTVIPVKKKPDSGTPAVPATKALKPKRRQFKKKPRNNMNAADGGRNRRFNQSSTGSVDANANADATVSAIVDAHLNVNANVDAHVNGNGNGNGNGNVDADVNGNDNVDANVNGNGNVDANVNGSEVTPLEVYTQDSGVQKQSMDAPYAPCSNTGSDGNGNAASLSNDVNLLQTSS